jgi:hypothetical protein
MPMKHYKWIRVEDITPYIKTGDYSDESFALVCKLYSAEGEEYPILSIGIFPNIDYRDSLEGVNISCGFKSKSQESWEVYSAYIPVELFNDVIEMLAEAKNKIENRIDCCH